jgi:hypothetical protein
VIDLLVFCEEEQIVEWEIPAYLNELVDFLLVLLTLLGLMFCSILNKMLTSMALID